MMDSILSNPPFGGSAPSPVPPHYDLRSHIRDRWLPLGATAARSVLHAGGATNETGAR